MAILRPGSVPAAYLRSGSNLQLQDASSYPQGADDPGEHGPLSWQLPLPLQSRRGGHRCGKRSAWNRAGGYAPLCFPEDISPDMVREFCEVLKMRGDG